MTVNALHEQFVLQKMSNASPLTHTSSLNAQLRLTEFIELEAAILARRTLMPSNYHWLLRQTVADRATGSAGDISMILKSAQHLTPAFGTMAAENPNVKTTEAGLSLDVPSELDVLCGRGGKSNNHEGNKKYRLVIRNMKARYRAIGSKAAKTDVSRAIVEHVHKYGGRFLRFDKEKKMYIVLNVAEARKKTSQALRESKALKWTK